MDYLSAILAFLVTLSMATERVTEVIKGLPGLSSWLSKERPPNSTEEELRKAAVHIVAIAVGTFFAYTVRDSIASLLKVNANWAICLLFGGLASGGSGIWNSTLDLVRTVKQQRKRFSAALPTATPHRLRLAGWDPPKTAGT